MQSFRVTIARRSAELSVRRACKVLLAKILEIAKLWLCPCVALGEHRRWRGWRNGRHGARARSANLGRCLCAEHEPTAGVLQSSLE